jgi:hypothetical protein
MSGLKETRTLKANGGRLRVIRDGAIVVGLLFNAAIFVIGGPIRQTVGADSFAYWALNIDHPYTQPMGVLGAFLYTPVAARLFAPASLLSWPPFWWIWLAVMVATTVWLGGSRFLWLFAFPPVALELYYGNVNLLIAAAIALGFRYPAAWAFVILTKVTPGIGLLWFAVRREWRGLGIAITVTVALAAVSFAVDGRLWSEWLTLLTGPRPPSPDEFPIPLIIRLPVAAVVVAWGATTDRRWTVPLAATLAVPALWIASFSILAAIPALSRPQLREPAH